MAQIEFDAFEYSERRHVFEQVKEHSNKTQSEAFFFLLLFYSPGAVHCFNSQEKQLKAGTGLTYTQRSKIDQRHPAWTNHSTEGEASKQTWKVQEAMTGLMVWKMLLMIEEKRLWLCLYPLIYLASGRQKNLRQILKLSFGEHSLKDGWMDRWVYMPLWMSDTFFFYYLYSYSSAPVNDLLACTRWCSSKLAVASADIKPNVI